MSNTPHELAEEFPAHAALIQSLKGADAHFTRLADRYHEINRDIHRAETNVEPTDDMYILEIRKERMRIKDEIAMILRTHETA